MGIICMAQNNDLMSFKRFYKDHSTYIKTENDFNENNNSTNTRDNFFSLRTFFNKNRNDIIDKISKNKWINNILFMIYHFLFFIYYLLNRGFYYKKTRTYE
jgi:hypothetical protein